MGRNTERDEKEALLRRERILKAGFELFSRNGIELVSLQSIAEAADVGIATLYKYYGTKANLVANISAYVWKCFVEECQREVSPERRRGMSFRELIGYYADMMIWLYVRRPDILRFSSSFKTYINREQVPEPVVEVHLNPLRILQEDFHRAYIRGLEDGSVRADIPEEMLYTTVGITMLSMVERYAQGIVWADTETRDYREELGQLKEMLLDWVSKKGAAE